MRQLPFFLLFPLFVVAQQLPNKRLVIHVEDVKPTTEPYNVWPTKDIVNQDMEERVLVCSQPEQTIVPTNQHSFLNTVHLAYAQHHDLVLSPDDIWIQIALGASIHINEHYAELKNLVLNNPEKETFFVRMDQLTELKSDNWSSLIETFSTMAKEKATPDFYAAMLPEFTTTTPESRTVMQSILLSSVKQSIDFQAASGCGIPNIVLLGEKADWEKLLHHTQMLDDYGLAFWTKELKPILQEFINAYDGKTDRQFWQRIYKYREMYMVMEMNGWISKFFPYFSHTKSVESEEELAEIKERYPEQYEMAEGVTVTAYTLNPYLEGDAYLFNPIDIRDLPNSVCEVPIIWNNLKSENSEDHEIQLKLYAGFTGAKQYDHFELQPQCGWFITRTDEFEFSDYNDTYLSAGRYREDWSEVAWSEKVVSGENANVIYNPAKYKSTVESLEALKKELISHLKKQFPKETLEGTELTFYVTHFGSCSDATISGGMLSEEAKAALLLKLKKLDYTFKPAVVMEDSNDEYENAPAKIPVRYNAKVVFQL